MNTLTVHCMQHAYLLTVACVLAAQAEVGRLDVFVDYVMLVDMLQSCQHASSILHKVVVAACLSRCRQLSQIWTCVATHTVAVIDEC